MLIDYIRQIHASQNFKIKDDFDFLSFDDLTMELTDKEEAPDHIEIWASVKISYDGTLPESYKILNLTVGDWVAKHEKSLTDILHEHLKGHFITNYPNSDISGLDEAKEDSAIWLDQLDYMPRINEADKSIIIEIELVLDSEPLED